MHKIEIDFNRGKFLLDSSVMERVKEIKVEIQNVKTRKANVEIKGVTRENNITLSGLLSPFKEEHLKCCGESIGVCIGRFSYKCPICNKVWAGEGKTTKEI